ncbi:MAG: hypothetical protein ABIH36_04330 [bacterium]
MPAPDPCSGPNPPPECSEPPEEEEPEPVILVPGLMASFNPQITLLNNNSSDDWIFFPGAENYYKALTERLQQAGINVTVAHYDWRQPAAENRHYLTDTIAAAKATSPNGKVDIVAHSFGGLVARDYIQSNNYAGDVDQLITLGTPHKGAADAYLALEGGIFPVRWGVLVRTYVGLVEAALVAQDISSLPRPQTFRTYFPSLQDILPIEPFVNQTGNLLNFGELAGFNNIYLKHLNDTIDDSFGSGPNKVELTTIAGAGLDTLDKVAVNNPADRSLQDIILDRWRDGHPQPDPPPPDNSEGDQTVLLASARLDDTPVILANHDKLPEEAQEEVLAALDNVESAGTHIAYDLPNSVLGAVALSPVIPVITFPDGSEFRCDVNKEGSGISCITDNNDPPGPKLLIISNPPAGDYEITLETIGDGGEYHLITSLADENGDSVVTKSGTAKPGENYGYYFTVGPDAEELTIEDIDVENLLNEIKPLAQTAKKQKEISGRQQGMIISLANNALQDWLAYNKRLKKDKGPSAVSNLASYYNNLDKIEQEVQNAGVAPIIELIQKIRKYSPT